MAGEPGGSLWAASPGEGDKKWCHLRWAQCWGVIPSTHIHPSSFRAPIQAVTNTGTCPWCCSSIPGALWMLFAKGPPRPGRSVGAQCSVQQAHAPPWMDTRPPSPPLAPQGTPGGSHHSPQHPQLPAYGPKTGLRAAPRVIRSRRGLRALLPAVRLARDGWRRLGRTQRPGCVRAGQNVLRSVTG